MSDVRALVIDDSRTMRAMLARQLQALGYDVLQAGHGQEALALLEEQAEPPALATVDWNMPVMDGLTFVQTVRKRPQWRGITLMMVTTESEHGQIVRALAAGAHDYLIKPFLPEAFVEKLDLLGLAPRRVRGMTTAVVTAADVEMITTEVWGSARGGRLRLGGHRGPPGPRWTPWPSEPSGSPAPGTAGSRSRSRSPRRVVSPPRCSAWPAASRPPPRT